MEYCQSQGCSECLSDYGFGFNDAKFSDRTIQLDIITPYLDDDFQLDLANQTDLPRKRNRLSDDDSLEESDGHAPKKSYGNSCSSPYNCSTETKTIHINTLILAGKSPFFYKLFSNGMAESNQQHVTLQIQKSEESSFMDMLKFMYTNTLSNSTPSVLLDILAVADKYEVSSCTNYCSHSLQNLPMTCEIALFYLDLQSTILLGDTVQSLKDSAKVFLVARFKDISKFQNEMLSLPLHGIDAILSSDDLQVSSEDEIYDFVMKWTRHHYTRLGERQEVLNTHLLRLIRFTFMSRCKLQEVLACSDIYVEHRSKLVFNAISLETLEQPRAYKLLPVKVVRFNSPNEECVVYLDLKHEVCASLLLNGEIYSQPFVLGGQAFHLIVTRNPNFGLLLCKKENGLSRVEIRFSARKKPSQGFVPDYYDEQDRYGRYSNLFDGISWTSFIAEDSPFFISGVLYLMATLKMGWA